MDLGFSVDQPSRGRDDRTIGWVQVVLGPAQELLMVVTGAGRARRGWLAVKCL